MRDENDWTRPAMSLDALGMTADQWRKAWANSPNVGVKRE